MKKKSLKQNKEVIFIKRTEKERNKRVLIISILISLVYWAFYGLFVFGDSLINIVSCNGFFSCSFKLLGGLSFFVFVLVVVWLLFYLLSNMLVSKYRKK